MKTLKYMYPHSLDVMSNDKTTVKYEYDSTGQEYKMVQKGDTSVIDVHIDGEYEGTFCMSDLEELL